MSTHYGNLSIGGTFPGATAPTLFVRGTAGASSFNVTEFQTQGGTGTGAYAVGAGEIYDLVRGGTSMFASYNIGFQKSSLDFTGVSNGSSMKLLLQTSYPENGYVSMLDTLVRFSNLDLSWTDFKAVGMPSGTLWNSSFCNGTSGWSDFSDLTTREYMGFVNALNSNVGSNVTSEFLVMWDTINNKYHRVKFSSWQNGGNGGGFSYDRSEIIDPITFGPTVSFTRTNYGSEVDNIDTDISIARASNGGSIYNPNRESRFQYNVASNMQALGASYYSVITSSRQLFVMDSMYRTKNTLSTDTGVNGFAITTELPYGSGMTDGTHLLSISGTAGTGCTVSVGVSGGSLISVEISSSGSGYDNTLPYLLPLTLIGATGDIDFFVTHGMDRPNLAVGASCVAVASSGSVLFYDANLNYLSTVSYPSRNTTTGVYSNIAYSEPNQFDFVPMIAFNPDNEKFYVSAGRNQIFVVSPGASASIVNVHDVAGYFAFPISRCYGLKYCENEIVFSCQDLTAQTNRIFSINSADVLQEVTDLDGRVLPSGDIVSFVNKIDGKYFYYVSDYQYSLSYYYDMPITVIPYENSVITLPGLTSSFQHYLQQSNGTLAHLSDIAVMTVNSTGGLLVTSQSLDLNLMYGKTIWVDSTYGNNGTAQKYSFNRPYQTISQALAVFTSGDLIYVRSGQYFGTITLINGLLMYCEPGVFLNSQITDGGSSVNSRIYGKATLNRGYANDAIRITGSTTNFYGEFYEIRGAGTLIPVLGGTKVHIKCENVVDSIFNGLFYRPTGSAEIIFEATGYVTWGGNYGSYSPGAGWSFLWTVDAFTGSITMNINELRMGSGTNGIMGCFNHASGGTVKININRITGNVSGLSSYNALFNLAGSCEVEIKIRDAVNITNRDFMTTYGYLYSNRKLNGLNLNLPNNALVSGQWTGALEIIDCAIIGGTGTSYPLMTNLENGEIKLKIRDSQLTKVSDGSESYYYTPVISFRGVTTSAFITDSFITMSGSTGYGYAFSTYTPASGTGSTATMYFINTRSNVALSEYIIEGSSASGFLGNETYLNYL